MIRCDFCLKADLENLPSPAWEYPAAPMEIADGPFTGSEDDFAACDDCYQLIEAHDIEALIARVVYMQPAHMPEGTLVDGGFVHYAPEPQRVAPARENILRFMDARKGPARPLRA